MVLTRLSTITATQWSAFRPIIIHRIHEAILFRPFFSPVTLKRKMSGDAKTIMETIKKAAKVIKEAKAIVITSGAGMGVDSGLPDFRGPEGFWKAYPPIKKLGLTLPEVSTPRWFKEDPEFAWGFFGHRLKLYRKTKPHKGFDILKNWAESKPNGYFVYTSNVDGHFQKAGFPEENVVECHGSLEFLQCTDGRGEIWPLPKLSEMVLDIDESTLKVRSPLPMGPPGVQPELQQLARPNILMFGDWHFIETRVREQLSRYEEFVSNLISQDVHFVVIEIGAGLAVPTIRYLGERLVRYSSNGLMIRINPTDTDIPSKDHLLLPIGGLEALERIDKEIEKMSSKK